MSVRRMSLYYPGIPNRGRVEWKADWTAVRVILSGSAKGVDGADSHYCMTGKSEGSLVMARLLSAATSRGHHEVDALFEAGGPILVEVRHPGAVESSDWFLLEEQEAFDELISRLEPNVVMLIHRVWDLTNHTGGVCLRR